ncbi:MAG TPA: hypothetical protein VMT88_12235 [Actinomycetes bacterium]|nr:hypothetical protein [Actinomycetes bacterium]
MKWLPRRGSSRKKAKGSASSDRKYLEEFAQTRQGVEAFVEPQTAMSSTTIVLVARDGEWTRRAVPNPQTAFSWANKLGIPCYDVNLVGYPKRMRDWSPGS